jgi:hypothetical protein
VTNHFGGYASRLSGLSDIHRNLSSVGYQASYIGKVNHPFQLFFLKLLMGDNRGRMV